MALYNRVKYTAASGGLGGFVTGASIVGFRTPATASVANGATVSYVATSADQSQWETGRGTYDSGLATVARTTILESSSGGATVNFSAAPTVAFDVLAQDLREVLTADRTYYVRTTGSDSNNGLASSTAFLTLTHAMMVLSSTLDSGGMTITLDIGAGAFAGLGLRDIVGAGALYLNGAGAGSTTITGGPYDGLFNANECIGRRVPVSYRFFFNNVTLAPPANIAAIVNGAAGLISSSTPADDHTSNWAIVGNGGYGVALPSAGAQFYDGASAVTISGAFDAVVQANFMSQMLLFSTWTLSGTPTFNNFAECLDNSAFVTAASFSGAGTGARYSVGSAGVINTFGGGANFFPGTIAGSNDGTGVYL